MIRKNKLDAYVERCMFKENRKPITADVFLTDFCNEKCKYCRYSNTSGNYINFNTFVKYANRLLELGVRGIILTGGGEPTINKDFDKIVDWLQNNNIPYGINTNFKKYIECNPNYLKISIDTGDRHEYKRLRGVDSLEDVLSNISRFCEYKGSHKLNTSIGVQCVVTTEHNIVSFYEKVKNLNVDYIYFRPLEIVEGEVVNRNQLIDWLNNNNIDDKRINISYKFDMMDYKPLKCFANFCNICVDTYGNVPYCCHLPHQIVGNIMDDDILVKKSLFLNDMSQCEHPCRLSDANKYMETINIEKDICFI